MYIILGITLSPILKIMELLKIRVSHGGMKAVISQYHIFKKRVAVYYLLLVEKV